MAKEAYEKVELRLSDGTEVTLKPLNISRLKRFMKAFNSMRDNDKDGDEIDEIAGFDVFVSCAGIALESELKDQFEETKAGEGKWISDEYREYLEETLDMETIYKVIEVCAGMKLNDPNLLRAVAEAQAGIN